MKRSWRYGREGVAIALTLFSGCAEELGPESRPTTCVVGVVREGPRPIGGGWIEFQPVEGTIGDLRTAPVRPDGSFTADGVAVGVNRIALVRTSLQPYIGRMFHPSSSRLRRVVPAGATTTLTIDLIEEVVRRRQERLPGP